MKSTKNIEKCTLHVCISCRPKGHPRDPKKGRSGYLLYHQLREALKTSPLQPYVDLKPAECLSICPRPCGIAISSPGAWTYLFGDQQPHKTTQEILECLATYLDTPDGFMTRDKRPKSLRSSILGRIPSRPQERPCT